MNIADVRNEYSGEGISTLPAEPHRGIELWLAEALKIEDEATAFSLATQSAASGLSVRVVLAKNISAEGLTFYTNMQSLKGRHLAASPVAAGVFFWPKLHRQVRFEGKVTPVSAADADAYFDSRPRDSQIAAAVSRQSTPLDSYESLKIRFAQAQADLDGKKVARPESWGGYLITFERVEFWQGQESRLHQRLLYERTDSGSYSRTWLEP